MIQNKFCLDLETCYYCMITSYNKKVENNDTLFIQLNIYSKIITDPIVLTFKQDQENEINHVFDLIKNQIGEDYILISEEDKIYVEKKYKS